MVLKDGISATQEETSQLQNLIIIGALSHLDSCRMSNMTGYKKSRKCLGCVNKNFFMQVLHKLTRGNFLLDLLMFKKRQN